MVRAGRAINNHHWCGSNFWWLRLPTIRPQPHSGGAGGLEATYQVFTPSCLVHILPLKSVHCLCFVKYKFKHRNKLPRVSSCRETSFIPIQSLNSSVSTHQTSLFRSSSSVGRTKNILDRTQIMTLWRDGAERCLNTDHIQLNSHVDQSVWFWGHLVSYSDFV